MRPLSNPVDRSLFSPLWLFRGSVPVPAGSSHVHIMDVLEGQLHDQGVTVFREEEPALWFSDSLFRFGPNWKTMVMFDRGWAWFEERGGSAYLCYQVRCFQGFLFCLFATAMFGAVGFAAEGVSGLRMGLLGIGWLYGMNLILAAIRVPLFFDRAASRAVA